MTVAATELHSSYHPTTRIENCSSSTVLWERPLGAWDPSDLLTNPPNLQISLPKSGLCKNSKIALVMYLPYNWVWSNNSRLSNVIPPICCLHSKSTSEHSHSQSNRHFAPESTLVGPWQSKLQHVQVAERQVGDPRAIKPGDSCNKQGENFFTRKVCACSCSTATTSSQ